MHYNYKEYKEHKTKKDKKLYFKIYIVYKTIKTIYLCGFGYGTEKGGIGINRKGQQNMKLKEWFLSLKDKQNISEKKECKPPKRFVGAILEDYSVTEEECKEVEKLLRERRERERIKSIDKK